jgi:hypothetical protein
VAAASEGERKFLAVAEDAATRIDKEQAVWAVPFADLVRAGVAGVADRSDVVAARLESARVGLSVADLPPWLAVSHWQNQARADAGGSQPTWFIENGIRNRDRFAALFVPGVSGRRSRGVLAANAGVAVPS